MTHGGAPRAWLEFSANLNPLGTPAGVARAIAAAPYAAYADLDTDAAAAHLARDSGVAPEDVLLTAGATEAIRLVAESLAPGRVSIIVGPTYGEYARAVERAGGDAYELRAAPARFDPPVDAIAARTGERASVTWICDPNNPTGRSLGDARLRGIVASTGEGSLVVLDQSFGPFVQAGVSAAELVASERVVLIRSLTKLLAIPGVRAGYVVAAGRLIAALRDRQDPWSVGAHAIAAAGAASFRLSPNERAVVGSWRDRLVRAVAALGWDVVPSDANFILARPTGDARHLAAALASRRIAVRDCASFGLEGYLRLAVRPPAEQDELLHAVGAPVAV